jgi:hypothetical protein
MRSVWKAALGAAMVSGAFLGSLGPAWPVDLTGAWATNADECNNVFIRSGKANEIGFAELSEMHGSGFIVEPDRLVGRFAKCKIKAKKENGQNVNIVANCATDIMLSSVQFELKVDDENKITRLFPGMEDMAISYHRCPI